MYYITRSFQVLQCFRPVPRTEKELVIYLNRANLESLTFFFFQTDSSSKLQCENAAVQLKSKLAAKSDIREGLFGALYKYLYGVFLAKNKEYVTH